MNKNVNNNNKKKQKQKQKLSTKLVHHIRFLFVLIVIQDVEIEHDIVIATKWLVHAILLVIDDLIVSFELIVFLLIGMSINDYP